MMCHSVRVALRPCLTYFINLAAEEALKQDTVALRSVTDVYISAARIQG